MVLPVRSLLGLPRRRRNNYVGNQALLISWWDLRISYWIGACIALLGLVMALVADGRHHRAVLRCVRHENIRDISQHQHEDTDCILTRNPRGIDRLWQKRHRSSFEISSAALEIEMSHPLWGIHRNRVVKRNYNSSNFHLGKELAEMRAQLFQQEEGNKKIAFRQDFRQEEAHLKNEKTSFLINRGKNILSASVIVFDEFGHSRVLHRFDEPERATRALRAVETYLSASKDTGPVSLALRYDDSASDELLVLLCIAALIYFACLVPALEIVIIAKICTLERRNILGFRLLDFHCTADQVAALHVNEHRDIYDADPSFSLRLVLSPDFSFPQDQPATQTNPSSTTRTRTTTRTNNNNNICSPCLDLDLCFGDKFSDSAQLRRLAEAANAALLDLDQQKSFLSSSTGEGITEYHPSSSNRKTNSGNFLSSAHSLHHEPPLLCAVCRSRPRDTVLFPCRHLYVCRACASCLSDCPICRTPIQEKHVIFL
uniref:RING-type domain-containing protein n=1 Tax=Aureoumbra lagunensis TaxID=44058 RepID=A0A7S3JVP1_9STRA|mmetsp:Transcript_5183/g.7288  ORF Transcript_5183/g.7288 Transcript_5183/m.7288 type:complete len:486 (+) Transcript_5183:42-1499(+)